MLRLYGFRHPSLGNPLEAKEAALKDAGFFDCPYSRRLLEAR
jgi:hypothetical protein